MIKSSINRKQVIYDILQYNYIHFGMSETINPLYQQNTHHTISSQSIITASAVDRPGF